MTSNDKHTQPNGVDGGTQKGVGDAQKEEH